MALRGDRDEVVALVPARKIIQYPRDISDSADAEGDIDDNDVLTED